jgi:hypothetical protein
MEQQDIHEGAASAVMRSRVPSRDVVGAWAYLLMQDTALTDLTVTIRDRHGDQTADALQDLFDALLRSDPDPD